jgi:glyoxylase-like metal-dependent hydrolase (beta-lactamase superfamily II)
MRRMTGSSETTKQDVEVVFDRSFSGGASEFVRLSPLVRRMAAGNPGPMTFTGTCTYVVGAREVAIIDPGPDSKQHLDTLLQALRGETVAAILVTHTHKDHSPGARALQHATGARIIGCAPYGPPASAMTNGMQAEGPHDAFYAPDQILREGDVFEAKGFALVGVETPGHTKNHLAFFLPQEQALFSGDHVMAWSTSIVAPPDGSMRDYMASLEKLRRRDDRIYWPGHGGPVFEPQRYVRALAHHRRQRERAILSRLEAGDATIETIVTQIYEGLAPTLRFAAGLSVLAHLQDLMERGLVVAEGPAPLDAHYRPA